MQAVVRRVVAVGALGLISSLGLTAPSGAQAVTQTSHCGRTAVWSVATKVRLSKYITLTFWGTSPDHVTSGWCVKLVRTKITQKYLKLSIDGVGPYTAKMTVSRYVSWPEGNRHNIKAVLLDGKKKTVWTSSSTNVG